jgi:hypothetical protein
MRFASHSGCPDDSKATLPEQYYCLKTRFEPTANGKQMDFKRASLI